MIGWLRGRLAAKHPPALVVDVNGVGYECEAPMSTFYGLPETGAEVLLRTHLVVREDAHILFAFGTEEERRLFRSLLRVSGVGPKIALGILSGITIDDFMLAVEAQDPEPLVRVPGVGRKTAERVLIDLRDRVKELAAAAAAQPSPPAGRSGSAQSEAYSALVALGYRPAEVARLLKSVGDEADSVEELIRRALRAAAG
ncbi:MAG TPA: Holliday junction branch migration protein RuvA [Steroidobacteraceae bacterium]|nr:Holliday junction branch migration protein RuvA [Steroidobacteraceae bacterium]